MSLFCIIQKIVCNLSLTSWHYSDSWRLQICLLTDMIINKWYIVRPFCPLYTDTRNTWGLLSVIHFFTFTAALSSLLPWVRVSEQHFCLKKVCVGNYNYQAGLSTWLGGQGGQWGQRPPADEIKIFTIVW